jgi:hypothetical protein
MYVLYTLSDEGPLGHVSNQCSIAAGCSPSIDPDASRRYTSDLLTADAFKLKLLAAVLVRCCTLLTPAGVATVM